MNEIGFLTSVKCQDHTGGPTALCRRRGRGWGSRNFLRLCQGPSQCPSRTNPNLSTDPVTPLYYCMTTDVKVCRIALQNAYASIHLHLCSSIAVPQDSTHNTKNNGSLEALHPELAVWVSRF